MLSCLGLWTLSMDLTQVLSGLWMGWASLEERSQQEPVCRGWSSIPAQDCRVILSQQRGGDQESVLLAAGKGQPSSPGTTDHTGGGPQVSWASEQLPGTQPQLRPTSPRHSHHQQGASGLIGQERQHRWTKSKNQPDLRLSLPTPPLLLLSHFSPVRLCATP